MSCAVHDLLDSHLQEEEVDPGEIEGTDLRVLKYPHPKLRAVDEEVTEFDQNLKQVHHFAPTAGTARISCQ